MGMQRTKVTSKYQLTIPKEVRRRINLRPGEVVGVEAVSEEEIVIKRLPRVREPLKVLLGERPVLRRSVSIEELEEKIEES